jgi:Fe-S-cluster containining protein
MVDKLEFGRTRMSTDGDETDELDCTKCGACCWCHADNQDYFCNLTEAEMARLPQQFVKHLTRGVDVLDGEYMPPGALKTKWKRMKSGPFKDKVLNVCVMLDGSLLSRVKCRIYNIRPKACRNAANPGDEGCLRARSMLLDLLASDMMSDVDDDDV